MDTIVREKTQTISDESDSDEVSSLDKKSELEWGLRTY